MAATNSMKRHPSGFKLIRYAAQLSRPRPGADRSVLAEADELLEGKANYFSRHA